MKKLRLRIANEVDVTRIFSASIRGGQRGFADACALETHSNDVCPTIKTIEGFTVIVEPYDDTRFKFYGVSENFGRKLEWQTEGNNIVKKHISPTLRAVDYKIPKLVWYVYERQDE